MSKLFSTWRFRTATPSFEPGETITVYITGFDEETGAGQARIGDTQLTVQGAAASDIGRLVELRVDSFEPASATGSATIVE